MRRRSTNRRGEQSTNLTPRERQIVALVANGDRNEDIAQTLGLAYKTVAHAISSATLKRGLDNRVQLTLWWLEQGRLENRTRLLEEITRTEERLQLLRRLESGLQS